MSHKSTAQLSVWQRKYAKELLRILKKNCVALLQLPTGMGKTAIVMKAIHRKLTKEGWRVIFSMPRRWEVPQDSKRSDENGQDSEKGKRKNKTRDPFELFPWLRERDLQLAGYTEDKKDKKDEIKKLRGNASGDPGKVVVTSHIFLSRKSGAKKQLFKYSRGRGSRPIGLNKRLIPRKAVVVLDEVHRARRLLAKIARSELKRRSTNVWFVFVSATPVNPVSHDYLCSSMHVQKLDQQEEREIRTGYLHLYKALVKLSCFTKKDKEKYLCNMESSKANLKDLAQTLSEISNELAVPECKDLCELKRKLRTRKRRKGSFANVDTTTAVKHLMEFQEGARKLPDKRRERVDTDRSVLECFAVAGALYPQKKEKALSFPKGQHHNLSRTTYECDELHKRCSKPIKKMTYKLDCLRDFLKRHLETKGSGKVVIFCNYRRTAWWVSAWLELWLKLENDLRKELGNGCSGAEYLEKLYGKMGKKRRVVDTVTYSSPKSQKEAAHSAARDRDLVTLFNSQRNNAVVLVTTDRLSESVDLHKRCNTLIHFDLAWSPLRMMQRVGRLWRYGAYKNPKKIGILPPFPRVYHLRYPCSIDDEKYVRLKRRWERLGDLGLGLDFVPFEACVGEELGRWEEEVQHWMAAGKRSGAKQKALPVKNDGSEAAVH